MAMFNSYVKLPEGTKGIAMLVYQRVYRSSYHGFYTSTNILGGGGQHLAGDCSKATYFGVERKAPFFEKRKQAPSGRVPALVLLCLFSFIII